MDPNDHRSIIYNSQDMEAILMSIKRWIDELVLLNCGVGEDSWESLGLQGDQTSQS